MRALAFLTLAFALSACSLYESQGRKYLEKNAYQFAGLSAQQNLLSCGAQVDTTTHWELRSENERARVFENAEFGLHIVPAQQTGAQDFSCDYKFNSASELVEKVPDAVDLTLAKYKDAE